jgi:branched-chain amino acid transport system permease protein
MAFYRPAPYQKPLAIVLLLAALALPSLLSAFGQEFYVGFATRVLIFALAASSLNLVLGFGGMFSLGHAAFFGAGAYVAAICMQAGISDALLAFPLAMLAAGLLALLVGAHQPADARGLFHHDHAGFRPDGVLPVRFGARLGRR